MLHTTGLSITARWAPVIHSLQFFNNTHFRLLLYLYGERAGREPPGLQLPKDANLTLRLDFTNRQPYVSMSTFQPGGNRQLASPVVLQAGIHGNNDVTMMLGACLDSTARCYSTTRYLYGTLKRTPVRHLLWVGQHIEEDRPCLTEPMNKNTNRVQATPGKICRTLRCQNTHKPGGKAPPLSRHNTLPSTSTGSHKSAHFH